MHIGLYFGTFNPVHNGHIAIAGYIAQFSDLEQVWMVVSPHNPLKKKSGLLQDHHRMAMLRLTLEDYTYLKPSDIEFNMPQPSYTVHTLAWLGEKYPQHSFSLIMGADNLENLHKWKNFEVILENHLIYVYPRPGHSGGQFAEHKSVRWVEGAPLIEISSTFIRKAVKEKKDIRYFMPEKAWTYMREMHFYER